MTEKAREKAVPAKHLFGAKALPSLGKSMAIGYYPRGCLAGGVELPVNGPNWQVMRLSRNRNWGHPSLVHFIEKFAARASKATGWNGILVGDLAQPRGGPSVSDHASHQTGLDVDIWFMPMPDRVLSKEERDTIPASNLVAADWKRLNPQTWTPQHVAFIKTAAQQPEVERVLVNAAIKKELCRVEAKSAACLDGEGAAVVRPPRSHSRAAEMSGRFAAMQGAAAGARRRRLQRQGAGLLVLRQGHSAEKAGAAGTPQTYARGPAACLQNACSKRRQEDQSRHRQALIAVAQRPTPMPKSTSSPNKRDDLQMLAALERKVLWLASWMIHNANHLRENDDGLKVGGHQASSASLATIMTALYFDVLRPQDRVAVKPHASPIFHAIQYLLGNQTRERLEAFRGYKGAQSYPSRTKDADDVDFSTGSVGLGVAQTLFSSLTQDYVRAHGWGLDRPEGRMVALVGDAELDEGNIFEALLEGWKQGLRNCWWIIDYNRQSLDAVVREGLWERYEQLFKNFGWNVVIVKYGSLQQAAFKEPGGETLAPLDRQLPEPALLGAGVCGRRGLAQATERRNRRPGRRQQADRKAE